jgi:hypothetical protein
LTAAQTVFDNEQKKEGKATVVTVADLASPLPAGSKYIITGNVVLTSAIELEEEDTSPTPPAPSIPGAILIIAPGAKLTTLGAASSLVMGADSQLIVKAGGTFELAKGTTSSSNKFEGTIIIESGATSIDRSPGGSPLTGGGKIIVFAGATDILNSHALTPTPPPGSSYTYQDIVRVGPASGNNKGQILQLTSGTFTGVSGSGYILEGDATLVAEHSIAPVATGLKLTSNSTLTIVGGGDLRFTAAATNVLSTSEEDAKIILRDADSYITTDGHTAPAWMASAADWGNVYDVDGTTLLSRRLTGPAVLVKGNAANWTKQ